MSLSRAGEDAEWFAKPGYIYLTGSKFENGYKFNTPIRTPEHFCEIAMRALDQSGELDDEVLEDCEEAFRERFSYVFEEDNE